MSPGVSGAANDRLPAAISLLPTLAAPATLAPLPSPTDNVYITNLEDQNTILFVEELQRRLAAAAAAAAGPHPLGGPSSMFLSQSTANLAGSGGGVPLSSISAAHEELPFELRALEIALDTVRPRLGGAAGGNGEGRCSGVCDRGATL